MTLPTGTYPYEGTGKLGPKDKAVLKFVMERGGSKGLTAETVAKAIGWEPEAVTHSFSRIRKQLRREGFDVRINVDSIYLTPTA